MKLKKRRLMAIFLTICMVISIFPANVSAAEGSGCFSAVGGMVRYTTGEDGAITITGCDDTVTEIVIPDSIDGVKVTAVNEFAFQGNEVLASITFPAGMKKIGYGAFISCTKLAKADFSACTDELEIDGSAFQNDTALSSIAFPEKLIKITEYAFYGCSNLTSVSFKSANVDLSIGSYAFATDAKLASVTFPGSLTDLGNNAFDYCDNLTAVDFSACTKLTTVGGSAFANSGLKGVDFSACTKLTTIGDYAFYQNKALTSIKFPESLTELGQYAFAYCSALEGADFSKTSVKTIREGTFDESGIKSLKLSDSTTDIEYNAFMSCTALTSLELGKGLRTIGWQSFSYSGITSLKLPDSVEAIGSDAFGNCTSLTSVEWPDNENFTTVQGFEYCEALPVEEFNEAVALPSVTTIGESAFSGCSFKSVTIPANIRVIGDGAFYGMPNMTSLAILPGTASIGVHAFKKCTGLAGKTVVLPETVEEVKGGAFADCFIEHEPEGTDGYTYTGITVKFLNRDFKLAPYDSNSYNMVTIDDVNYENPFDMGVAVIHAYETDSEGNISMLKKLYDVVKDETVGSQKRYTFEPIIDKASYSVSGIIPSGADVHIFQNEEEIPVTLSGNYFEAKAEGESKVSVTVSMDGYYDRHFIQPSLENNWDLGEITFSDKDKIPLNKTMRVDFGDVTVNGFKGLDITLQADGINLVENTDYTLQYPYIILADSVTADKFILTVNADAIGYTGGSATAGRSEGIFTLPLVQWGRLQVTVDSTFAGDEHVMIFTKDGSFTGQDTISKNDIYISDYLKSGDYTIIAYNANDSFLGVTSLKALDTLGLTEGTDYAKVTATVTDGNSTEVNVNVPLLKTDVSGILDKNKSHILAEKGITRMGITQMFRVYYGFASSDNGNILIEIPDGAVVKYICSEDAQLKNGSDYTANGNTVKINANKKEGVFYVMLSFTEYGSQTVSASASVGNMTAPIGNVTVNVEAMSITPLDSPLTRRNQNRVAVSAAPNSYVKLFVDGNFASGGMTNALGNVNLEYNLDETVLPGQTVTLVAQSGNDESSVTVSYAKAEAGLETWGFTGSWGAGNVSLYNTLVDIEDNYYQFEPGDRWTIYATFVGTNAPINVVTYIGMLSGSVEDVPMTLVKTEETGNEDERYAYRYTFAAEYTTKDLSLRSESGSADEVISNGGDRISADNVPESFGLDWEDAGENFSYDAETVAQIENNVQQRVQNHENALAEAKEKIGTTLADENLVPDVGDISQYIFGAKYHVSDTEWFASLTEEQQTAAYNLEKAIDKAIEEYSEAYGLKKNLTEYSSWDEVYDELGIKFSVNTHSASELREAGFTVCENNGTFTAFKDELEDSLNEDTHISDISGVGGVTSGFTFIDESGNQVDYMGNAASNIDQAINNNAYPYLEEAFGNFTNAIKSSPYCGSVEAGILDGLGSGMSIQGELMSLDNIRQDAEAMTDFTTQAADIQGYIDQLKMFENRYHDTPLCANAIMRERFTADKIRLLLDNEAFRSGANAIVGSILYGVGHFDKTGISDGFGMLYDALSCSVGARRAAEIQNLFITMDTQAKARYQKCGKTDMEKIMNKTRVKKSKKPIIDPSGIVYEAVESNTLSGVKATIWHADDENGTNAVMWNAQEYEQVNPLITDESGMYAWDVPSGWWQVRFEKDGYETAATGWMEVPPPRLGLKTALVSTKAPEAVLANAYPDYIEVVFSQYMDTSKKITLPSGMNYTWQSVDSGYSKILHITRENGFKIGDTVSFMLDGAYNYAGKALGSYNSGNLTVKERPAEIILNYESIISAKVGSNKNITVRIKDSEGNYMKGVNVNAALGSDVQACLVSGSAVTDDEGKAVFTLNTKLPGYTDITFSVAGTSLENTLKLHVTVDENRPKRPTAVIGDIQFDENSPKENYITVSSGEQLVLSAEDDVTIYYTTDDTCPCQNSAGRKVYTGPVTITENTKFRIAAYKDGMDYSERLNITVTVDGSLGTFKSGDADCNGNVNLNDVMIVLKLALGINVNVTEQGIKNADYDGSGNVDLNDAMYTLKEALGIKFEIKK